MEEEERENWNVARRCSRLGDLLVEVEPPKHHENLLSQTTLCQLFVLEEAVSEECMRSDICELLRDLLRALVASCR